eukprot:Nitzschia sp. Nitz4//scaffold37_size175936//84165//84907//NITZ4_002047-RA/size175936-augustus-gene-0.18-mRNA-1//-1//CDS//3329549791//4938//frame0
MSEPTETNPPPSTTTETPNDASASASETPVGLPDSNEPTTTASTATTPQVTTTTNVPAVMTESTTVNTPVSNMVQETTTTTTTATTTLDNDALSADAMVKAKKHKDRLEQNRISARESRKRKKTMIEELQKTVITMSRENKDLNARNEMLRNQLMEIGTKYPSVVPIQAILSGIGAPPTMANTPTTPHIIHHNHTPSAASSSKEPSSWQDVPEETTTV